MSFGFSAPRHRILISLKPYFPIITKQNRYHEKNQNIAKKMADNSEPAPSKEKRHCVKFNDLLRNLGELKVLIYVLCAEAI